MNTQKNKSETMLSPTNMSEGDIAQCRVVGARVDRHRSVVVNDDMRIEVLQMLLGDMGPPVLKRGGTPDTGEKIGRTQKRIDATKKIKKWWSCLLKKELV